MEKWSLSLADHGLLRVTIACGILTVISVVTQSLPTLVSHVLHSPCVEPHPLSSTGLPNLTLLTSRGAHVSQKVLKFKLQ